MNINILKFDRKQRKRLWRMTVVITLAHVIIGGALWMVGRSRLSRMLPWHRPPCVVLISIDTVRPDHLGCYGYTKRPTSPNLDRWASAAALFLQARCQAPWTLPSHMSLLTSMRPSHNRVEDINQKLPDDIPTLTELLKKAGYQTVAFVNNGQMKPHWGLARGFDVWREFEVDTPEGMAENITREAVQWLGQAPSKRPFCLFMHYYDAHDPYDPPSPFRERFGVTMDGEEARRITWDYHLPGVDFPDPAMLEQLRTAYDAEIAYLDDQLGRLLAAVPPDALVVIFSDHGEAFKEHGWTFHGATLYEEEIRTVLMIREPKRGRTGGDGGPGPGSRAREGVGMRITDPVMLLDVAPTILSYAGIKPPATFEGLDLRPAIAGKTLPPRLHFAETKRVLEGRILKSVMTPPAKLIHSVPDGGMEFYELPDESATRPESGGAAILRGVLRQWVQEDAYWMVRLQGAGRYDLKLQVRDGRLAVFVPFGFTMDSEAIDLSEDGRELSWTCYPTRAGKTLFCQTAPADAAVAFDVRSDGGLAITNLFVGMGSNEWLKASRQPMELRGSELGVDPFITNAVQVPGDGVFIRRYRMAGEAARAAANVQLDEKTVKQLRSLGYLQ